jgi:glycosyltransferase involved in cell wall biosynthesis
MRIAIVVPGRFHAFELAGGLVRRGHDVALYTNYPEWFIKRFDPSLENIHTCLPHAVLSRAALVLPWQAAREYCFSRSYLPFGLWAARVIRPEAWDCIHCYSGASQELLEKMQSSDTPSLLFRGSAHIAVQARLLREESARTGVPVDGPGDWMVAREEREYALANKILTLSSFARETFLEEGIASERVAVLPLGVHTAAFRASDAVVEQRCQRILRGDPLRILFVGNLSMQKGCWDLVRIMEGFAPGGFEWRLIGQMTPEVRRLAPVLSKYAHILPPQPHQTLARWYAEADIFLLPTIQDGFAAVLAEAQANALPLLTTTNSAGPDLVTNGTNGWVLPIRCPEAFIDRLAWAGRHRGELTEMVRYLHNHPRLRSWDDAAADFETIVCSLRAKRHEHRRC